jgi:photosystem II stability/assembly factor-like uncharacterized protein
MMPFRTILAGMILPAVVISQAAAQWTRCAGPTGGVIHELAVCSVDSRTMAAASLDGLLKSTDAGSTWTLFDTSLEDTVLTSFTAVAFAPDEKDHLFAGTLRLGLWESTDGGKSWNSCLELPGEFRICPVVIHPHNPQRLLLGTFGGGLFLSTDGGKRWRRSHGEWKHENISAILTLPGEGYPFLVGVWGKGLFWGHWEMETWERVAADFPLAHITVLRWTMSEERLMVGTYGHGLFHGSDAGRTLLPTGENFASRDVTDLLVDLWSPGTLYVSTDGEGVFRSTDGGQSWISINDGLDHKQVYSLAISHDWLYAGTCWGGIYRRPR